MEGKTYRRHDGNVTVAFAFYDSIITAYSTDLVYQTEIIHLIKIKISFLLLLLNLKSSV